MELRELCVRNAQPDAGDRALQRVDVLPVDVALGHAQLEVSGERPEGPLHAQPPEQAGGPDIDRHDVQLAVNQVEPDVVDADHLATLDVHDLLVQQIRLEQDLVLVLAEDPDVDRRHAQPRAGLVERLDVGPGQEDPAPIGVDDETGHRWVLVADRDDQVGDGAERLAVRIAHRQTDALAEEAHGGHLLGGSVRRSVAGARQRSRPVPSVGGADQGGAGTGAGATRSVLHGGGILDAAVGTPNLRAGCRGQADCSPVAGAWSTAGDTIGLRRRRCEHVSNHS